MKEQRKSPQHQTPPSQPKWQQQPQQPLKEKEPRRENPQHPQKKWQGQ